MLKHKSLYEILFKTKPVYSQLKVFDYLAFATTLINGRHKFDSRVGKCIFLGYPFGIKGYKLSDLEKHENFISHNVIFHENFFPFEINIKDCIVKETSVLPDLSTLPSFYFLK